MEQTDIILQCRQLTRLYRQGEHTVHAVDNCNLTLPRGSITAIMGRSGSGKSTLLHLLAGMESPTAGEISIGGQDILRMSEGERSSFRCLEMGFVFQRFHLLPVLTAEENILMPALISGRPASMTYLDELCDQLRLSDRRGHFPAQLSGGQQQRVAIARAMVNRPQILFADEPTGSLDRASTEELLTLLHSSVKRFGQTLLLVTHDLQVADIADTVYEMDDGILRHLRGQISA